LNRSKKLTKTFGRLPVFLEALFSILWFRPVQNDHNTLTNRM
jgi:hypothetical protein